MKKKKPSRVCFQVLSCLGYEVFLKYKNRPVHCYCTLLLPARVRMMSKLIVGVGVGVSVGESDVCWL